ncbi:LysR family transcriptional regulator [Pulveribacter sp.]|uniref:LysR family transcriptional regulator n=1 Tax=Pulveribacter sp. TaxID=2678893 RepID=UPI0028ACC5BF|nr:LysR family transcriptional regulator [Pulveribacter sp.]
MIDKLELNHLRTLDALYALGHMSAAAQRLGVTQQAVSLQLKNLRTLLGDPLFVRTGHGMVPTAYAQSIRAQVGQILQLVSTLPAPQSQALDQLERTLTLCATDYTQQIVVADLVAALREHAPRVRVLVANIEGAALLRRMQQGEIALAFTSSGYVPEGLHSLALFTERYVCASARALAAPGHTLALEALVAHGFVVVSPGVPDLEGSAAAWFARQGLQRRVALSVPSFFMAQQALRRTDLVGFMPSRLMPCEGLVDVPLTQYPPGYQVVAAWHPAAASDPLLAWMLEYLRARFAYGAQGGL